MADFYTLSAEAQARAMRDLAVTALACWGSGYTPLRLLKYRENAVFSVETPDGGKAVLRIHRHGYHTDAALRSELQWMEALGGAGLHVPRVIPAMDGRAFVTVACPSIPEPRQVDLLSWLDGAPVGDIETGLADDGRLARIYYQTGVLAGRLHNESSNWLLPAGFTRHSWDENGLLGATPFWGRFWELAALTPGQSDLLERARDKARGALAQVRKAPDSYGLIHADFVPENLLHDGRNLMLIDFDDAGFGWHMFEIATALIFHMDEPHYDAIRAALFAGYRSVRPLSAELEAQLPLFLLLRSFTYLGWVHTRSETQTARELTPMLVERAVALASDYLSKP